MWRHIFNRVPIYIANAEADQLARELAEKTGESITTVVIEALRERRDRLRPDVAARVAHLRSLSAEITAILTGRTLDGDELYDDAGLPR